MSSADLTAKANFGPLKVKFEGVTGGFAFGLILLGFAVTLLWWMFLAWAFVTQVNIILSGHYTDWNLLLFFAIMVGAIYTASGD